MDRPGNQFLARARLAEDQHGGVGAGDQLHPFHHRAEPRLDPDDRIAQGFASQPRQQRAFVGLGGLAQGGHLPHPQVIFQRHGERLQQQLGQLGVFWGKGTVGRGQKNQQAAMPRRIAQRSGQRVAVEPAENDCRQVRHCRFMALAMGHPLPATPRQQRFQFGGRAIGPGVGQAMLPAGQSNGHGLQARAGRVDPTDQHLFDREVPHQHGRDLGRRLADVDVSASLLPDIQEHVLEAFHGNVSQWVRAHLVISESSLMTKR